MLVDFSNSHSMFLHFNANLRAVLVLREAKIAKGAWRPSLVKSTSPTIPKHFDDSVNFDNTDNSDNSDTFDSSDASDNTGNFGGSR